MSFMLRNQLAKSVFVSDLESTGLFYGCEGQCRASTKFFKPVYGAMASHFSEPVDQVSAFVIAKSLQEAKSGFQFMPYTSVWFGLLNSRKREHICEKQNRLFHSALKKQFFHLACMEHFDINGVVMFSDKFWEDPLHWRIAAELFGNTPEIIPSASPFKGAFHKFSAIAGELAPLIEPEFYSRLSHIEGPRLYTLLEAAHVIYMKERFGADSKLGPASEKRFDEFIYPFMPSARFIQPVSLDSSATRIKTVIPYIGKRNENRIFFGYDSQSSVLEKLQASEKFSAHDSAANYDPKTGGLTLNPLVQYAIYATEAARVTANEPITIAGSEVGCGKEVIGLALTHGVRGWSKDVSRHLWGYLIDPVNEIVEKKWNLEEHLERAKQSRGIPENFYSSG